MTKIGPIGIAGLLVALSCAGLDREFTAWQYDGPVNHCENDNDCDFGNCDQSLGLCVLAAPLDGEQLYIKVIPPPEIDTPSQVFDVTLNPDGTVPGALHMGVPVVVQGKTQYSRVDETGGVIFEKLTARVIFTDVGNKLPGKPARITIYQSQSSVFDLELLPSTYNIKVIPEGDTNTIEYPVFYMDDVTITSTGVLQDSEGALVELIVPASETLVTGVAWHGEFPVNGIDVVALDPETGRVISTPGKTACVFDSMLQETCGSYAIRLAPGTTGFSLRASRKDDPHYPVSLFEGYTAPTSETQVLSEINLPMDPVGVPVLYQARVMRAVTSWEGTEIIDPASGAFVQLVSKDVSGGRVETWVTTNESGYLEDNEGLAGISLYSGCYQVTVIPALISSDSVADYATYLHDEEICVSDDMDPGMDVFTLSTRPQIEGTVIANDQKVPASTLDAEPVWTDGALARSSSGSTDRDGEFQIGLDSAQYRIVAEAPTESGFAWGNAVWIVEGDSTRHVQLEIPYVASLTLADDSIDVSGSVVEWYRVVDSVAYPVFRGIADANSQAVALLER